MTDTTETKKSGMRPGIRALLIGSLALNVLVISIVAGALLDGKGPPKPFGGFDPSLGPYTRALDKDQRDALRDDLRGRDQFRAFDREEAEAAMATFMTALQAEPFDPEAVDALFTQQRDRICTSIEQGQDALLGRLSAMDADDRGRFAERLNQGDRR